MQEITKKNLNSEKLWNFRAWENGGNGDKEMSLPLFLNAIPSTANDVMPLPYLRKENPAAEGLHIK